jgi:hypothetical protein
MDSDNLKKLSFKEDTLHSLEERSRELDFLPENVYDSEEESKLQINSQEEKRLRSNTVKIERPS